MSPLVMASVRFYLRQPWQLLLCLGGIALGVAVVAAMGIAIDSAKRGFQLSNEAVFGAVSHSLVAGQAGFDERLYRRLRLQLRHIPSAPVVSGKVLYPRPQGKPLPLEVLGIDPFAESGFRDYTANTAAGTPGASLLSRLISEPGSFIATPETLEHLNTAAGAPVQIQVAGHLRRLHLLGAVRPGKRLQRLGLENVLITDIASAQELLDRIGRLSRVDLQLAPGAAGQRQAAAITRLLPPGVRIETRAARQQALEQLTRSFYLNLRMLSALALVVGLFIVYNAMTFSVVRRREWMGYLRAVGVTGRGILALVLIEALGLGIAGTALGAPLGAALAQLLLHLLTRSLDDLYFTQQVRALVFGPESLPVLLLPGILGTLAAALAPALEATRISPRAAMLRSGLEQRVRRLATGLALGGLALALLIPLVLWLWPRSLLAGYGALFLAVIGFACLSPALTALFSRALGRYFSGRRAGLMQLALGGLRQGLSRNATAVTALMIALAASVGVGVMVESFRLSLDDWLQITLRADIYIAVEGREHTEAVDPVLAEAVARIPGIGAYTTSRDLTVHSEFGEVWLKGLDVRAPRPFRGVSFIGAEAPVVWRSLAAGEALVISESYAWRHRLEAGDSLVIDTPAGPRKFRIEALFRDYGSERGMLIMDTDILRRYWQAPVITDIGLYLAPGQAIDPLLERVRTLAANAGQRLRVFANRDIRELSLEIFDRTFAVTRVLEGLAILVAVAGILSALAALQLEQRRQVAVLRAQGLTRLELFVVQELQTGCLGLLAGLLAMPLGLILAGLLVEVINRRAFGWSLDFYLQPGIFIQGMLIALVSAGAAGLYPAWKLAHTPPAQAMRGL